MSAANRKRAWAYALVAVLLGAGIALANVILEGQAELTSAGAPAALRTVTGTDESADFDAPIDAQAMGGNPTIYVWGTFSAAGATATVEVSLHPSSSGAAMGVAWVGTLTASSLRKADSGRYVVEEVIATSGRSAPYYDVRVRDVSSGNFEPWVWTGQMAPVAGE